MLKIGNIGKVGEGEGDGGKTAEGAAGGHDNADENGDAVLLEKPR